MKPATFSSYRDYLDLRGTCPRGWGVKLLHEQRASDSGRHAERRDALAARAEGCQSGGAEGSASPNPKSPHTGKGEIL